MNPDLTKFDLVKPDYLIPGNEVMAILGIHNPTKFRELKRKGYIPYAWGQSKKSHLWSNTLIHEFKQEIIKNGGEYSKVIAENLTLAAFCRLIDSGTAKNHSG